MKIEDLNDAKELDQEESSAIVGGWTLSRYSSSATSTRSSDFGKISDGTSNTFSYFNWF